MLASPGKLILFLSSTYEGSVHDKKIADEAGIGFEKVVELLQDSGVQGFAPPNAIIIQPLKSQKARSLQSCRKSRIRKKLRKEW